MLPLYDNAPAAGLLAGILFGYALEGAGFGSPRKLTAQFRLTDFAVIKVMFTAVIVCAVGLWLAGLAGILKPDGVFVPTVYLWAIAAGGLFIGAGFAIGGYCPGTSAVGFASGRWDALVFILGMVAGTTIFAAFFTQLEAFYLAGKGPNGQTMMDLTGLPEWAILAIMAGAAFGLFRLGNFFERKLGGPLTAAEILESRNEISTREPAPPLGEQAVSKGV
ncbi:DUF6691 family protein [Afifella sp. IM 167]|uniref:DUF6691 family protein n=1 Tax=Afifella sp. IM 167 TaxID=2033586 RepID=UPI001CCA9A4E|nr:DUF6691 family protein [Afifella sp. IM 167]